MPKITYFDREKAAPSTTFHGVEFDHKVPVDLDEVKHLNEAQKRALIEMADANRFFEVEHDAPVAAADTHPAGGQEPTVSPYDEGWDASAAGAKRVVPRRYRDKPEAERWTTGFDDQVAQAGAAAGAASIA
jgi:hypothetical protein